MARQDPWLRIRDIEAIPLRVPLGRTYRGSGYQMTHRCTVVTRVFTEAGIVGEAYNGDESEEQAALVAIIRDEICPLLVGRDASRIESCWETTHRLTLDILRNRSLCLQAIAAVDSALWDAFGKGLDVPLYRLWGGYRDELPVIAIGGYYSPPPEDEPIAHEMESYRALGLAGCKFKVGGRSPEVDAARVRAARRAAGDDFVLAVDANQAWTVDEALRFLRLVADCNVAWFEEPCHWVNDRLAMRDVRFRGGIAVTAGQSEASRAGCRDLFAAGAVDICNFDASWGGGPTEWRRVAGLAQSYGVRMGHHEEPQIAAHLLAAIPHGAYLECFHPERDPVFFNLIANRSPFSGGSYRIPRGPGWGLALDDAFIRRYRTDGHADR